MHDQSEERYLEFSAASHIYRSLFYICSKRSVMSFLSLSNSKSKQYLSEEFKTDLVLWLTPCDLDQTQESDRNKQSCEEVSWRGRMSKGRGKLKTQRNALCQTKLPFETSCTRNHWVKTSSDLQWHCLHVITLVSLHIGLVQKKQGTECIGGIQAV